MLTNKLKYLLYAGAAAVILVYSPNKSHANEGSAAEQAYALKPSADVAEQVAREALAKNQLVRAINWAERMVRSPNVTIGQQSWVAKLRGQLKWKLGDLGFAELRIGVKPAHAVVSVDGNELRPSTAQHAVWVSEGAHTVTAEAPEFAPSEQAISIVRNEKSAIELVMATTKAPVIYVMARPVCDVLIDEKMVGTSKKQRFVVAAGAHRVELRAPGYLPQIRQLTLLLGEEYAWQANLERAVADSSRKPGPSAVDRDVTDLESGEAGESGPNIAHAPDIDSPLDGKRDSRVRVSRDAGSSSTVGSRKTGAADAVSDRADSGPSPAPVAAAVANSDLPSAPWSGPTKGLLLITPGLAMIAAGAAYTLVSTRAAERINQEVPYGDPDYEANYDKAAAGATIGYGLMAGGALLSGAGSYYVFGRDGFSKTRRGAVITASGVAAAGLGAWIWLGAGDVLASAAVFTAGHPEHDRRVALGQRDTLVGQGVAGAGVVIAGVGIWQLVSGLQATAHNPRTTPNSWAIVPVWSPHAQGAAFTATW